MICSNCNKENNPGAAFCRYCGSRLLPHPSALVCKSCGSPLSSEAKFCPGCGSFISNDKQSSSGLTCSVCGASLTSDMKYCLRCGASVNAFSSLSNTENEMNDPSQANNLEINKQPSTELLSGSMAENMNFSSYEDTPREATDEISPQDKQTEEQSGVPQAPPNFACHTCGSALRSTSNFCPVCGTPVARTSPYAPPPASHTEQFAARDPYEQKPPQKKSLKALWISLSVLLLAAVLVAASFFVFGSKSASAPPATSAPAATPQKTSAAIKTIVPTAAAVTTPPVSTPAPTATPTPTLIPATPSPSAEMEYLPNGDADPERFILELDKQYILYDELKGFTETQMGYILNGIYALSGKNFKTDKYIQYFNGKSWYIPNGAANESDEEVTKRFNNYQIANLQICVQFQRDMGWRK